MAFPSQAHFGALFGEAPSSSSSSSCAAETTRTVHLGDGSRRVMTPRDNRYAAFGQAAANEPHPAQNQCSRRGFQSGTLYYPPSAPFDARRNVVTDRPSPFSRTAPRSSAPVVYRPLAGGDIVDMSSVSTSLDYNRDTGVSVDPRTGRYGQRGDVVEAIPRASTHWGVGGEAGMDAETGMKAVHWTQRQEQQQQQKSGCDGSEAYASFAAKYFASNGVTPLSEHIMAALPRWFPVVKEHAEAISEGTHTQFLDSTLMTRIQETVDKYETHRPMPNDPQSLNSILSIFVSGLKDQNESMMGIRNWQRKLNRKRPWERWQPYPQVLPQRHDRNPRAAAERNLAKPRSKWRDEYLRLTGVGVPRIRASDRFDPTHFDRMVSHRGQPGHNLCFSSTHHSRITNYSPPRTLATAHGSGPRPVVSADPF